MTHQAILNKDKLTTNDENDNKRQTIWFLWEWGCGKMFSGLEMFSLAARSCLFIHVDSWSLPFYLLFTKCSIAFTLVLNIFSDNFVFSGQIFPPSPWKSYGCSLTTLQTCCLPNTNAVVSMAENLSNVFKLWRIGPQTTWRTFKQVGWGSMLCLWSGPPAFNCWISVAPAFRCWSCYWVLILFHLSILDSYVCCFDASMVGRPSRQYANRITCMFMNHSRA